MAVLDIILAPDPRLTTCCEPVNTVDRKLKRLMDDMLETMYAAPGIGLAAPQVGILKRLFVVDVGDEDARDPRYFINPKIADRSGKKSTYEEGCLSLPKQFGDVQRAEAVSLRYQDQTGAERTLEADGMLARCIQHEMDHLDGVLFIDHLSALKRKMILRRMTKAKRSHNVV